MAAMNAMTRKGKWTSEEEALTARIIHYFSLGVLQLPEGTTLRAYLAQKLDCDPMRITKKFTGTNCLGKRVYHSCERTTATYEVAKQAIEELGELEARFRARLERNKEKRSGILDIEARMLTKRHLGPNPTIDAMVRQGGLGMPPASSMLHGFGPASAAASGMQPNASATAAAVAVAATGWPPLPQGYPIPGYQFQPHHGVIRTPAGLMPSASGPVPSVHSFSVVPGAPGQSPHPHASPHHLTATMLQSHQLQHVAAYSGSHQLEAPQDQQQQQQQQQQYGAPPIDHVTQPGSTSVGPGPSDPQKQRLSWPPETQESAEVTGTVGHGQSDGNGNCGGVGTGAGGKAGDRHTLGPVSHTGADNEKSEQPIQSKPIHQQHQQQQPQVGSQRSQPPAPPQQQQLSRGKGTVASQHGHAIPAGTPQGFLTTSPGQLQKQFWVHPHAASDHSRGYIDYCAAHGFPPGVAAAGFASFVRPGHPLRNQPWIQQQQQGRRQGVAAVAAHMNTVGGAIPPIPWDPRHPIARLPSSHIPPGALPPPPPPPPLPPPQQQQQQQQQQQIPLGSGKNSSSNEVPPPLPSSSASSSMCSDTKSSVVRTVNTNEKTKSSKESKGEVDSSESGEGYHSPSRSRRESARRARERNQLEGLGGASSADAAAVVSAERDTVSMTMALPREIQQMYEKGNRASSSGRHGSIDGQSSMSSSSPRSGTLGTGSSLGSTTAEGSTLGSLVSSFGSISGRSSGSSASGSRTESGSDGQGSKTSETRKDEAGPGEGNVSTSGSESGSEEMDKLPSTPSSPSCKTSPMDVDGAGGLLMGFIESITKQHKLDQQQQQERRQQHGQEARQQQEQQEKQQLSQERTREREDSEQQSRSKDAQHQHQKLRPIPPNPHAFPRVRHKHAARMELEARCTAVAMSVSANTTTSGGCSGSESRSGASVSSDAVPTTSTAKRPRATSTGDVELTSDRDKPYGGSSSSGSGSGSSCASGGRHDRQRQRDAVGPPPRPPGSGSGLGQVALVGAGTNSLHHSRQPPRKRQREVDSKNNVASSRNSSGVSVCGIAREGLVGASGGIPSGVHNRGKNVLGEGNAADEPCEFTTGNASISSSESGNSNSESGGYEEDGEGGSSGKESGSTEESNDPFVSEGEYGAGDERSSSFEGGNFADDEDRSTSSGAPGLSPDGEHEGEEDGESLPPDRHRVEACS